MRDYKFRAWNPRENKMITPFITIDVHRVIMGKCPDWIHRDYKIMQFTGLKDENGVEIYEGDIVASTYNTTDEIDFRRPTFIVKWEQQGFIEYIDEKHCEVIGNIYENKELLNEQ